MERLNKEINAVLARPENRKRMTELGMSDIGGSPDDLAKLLAADLPRMKEVVQRSGARID
ncbi:hypothetical protein D9M72_638550 [compost metagenome]